MKRRAGSCGGAEVAAAEVVEGRRRWREIGIGAALEGETHVRARNGHFRRRFKDLCLVSLSSIYIPTKTNLSVLFDLRWGPSSPLYKSMSIELNFYRLYNKSLS